MEKIYKLFLLITFMTLIGCQQIKNITHTLSSFTSLRFKIENVSDFMLAGVPIATKSSIKDFSPVDALKIGNEIARNKLPVAFIVNIAVKIQTLGSKGPNQYQLRLNEWIGFYSSMGSKQFLAD